jgi:hypothetical protein
MRHFDRAGVCSPDNTNAVVMQVSRPAAPGQLRLPVAIAQWARTRCQGTHHGTRAIYRHTLTGRSVRPRGQFSKGTLR